MQILVFNERDIQHFKSEKKYAVISIQDPNYEFVKIHNSSNCVGIKKFKFYDLDRKTGQSFVDCFLFTKYDAVQILSFVESIKDKIDILCVNCVAGISRSAGVAGALAKIYNDNDEYYFQHYCPNRYVYKMILNTYYEQKEKR